MWAEKFHARMAKLGYGQGITSNPIQPITNATASPGTFTQGVPTQGPDISTGLLRSGSDSTDDKSAATPPAQESAGMPVPSDAGDPPVEKTAATSAAIGSGMAGGMLPAGLKETVKRNEESGDSNFGANMYKRRKPTNKSVMSKALKSIKS